MGGRDSPALRSSVSFLPSSPEFDGRGGTEPPGRGGNDLPVGRGGRTLVSLCRPLAAAAFFDPFDPRLPLPAPRFEDEPSSFDLALGPASDDVLSSPMVLRS